MLDFRVGQLRSFLTLAQTLNYARASRMLYMAQPTLSNQIKSLEDSFGIQLFHRTKKQVALTAAGEKLLVSAERMLQQLEQARVEMTSVENSAPVRVCSSQSGHYEMVPALLRLLSRNDSALKLEFQSLLPQARKDALLQNRVDALLMVPAIQHEDIAFHSIAEERLMAAVPAREPYLSMSSISIYDFAKETLLLPMASQCEPCKHRNLAVFANFGLRPATMEAPIDLNARMALIAGGSYVGFIGDSARSSTFPGVMLLNFQEELETQHLGIAWRQGDETRALTMLLDATMLVRLRQRPSSVSPLVSRSRSA